MAGDWGLPTETEALATWRGVARTWAIVALCTAILAVCGNAWLGPLAIGEDEDAAYLVAKWRVLRTLSEPLDWLVLGDSSANCAVVPSVLCESFGSGLRAVNLGTMTHFGMLDDAWMLQDAIAAGAVPRNVLIVHVGRALSAAPRSDVITRLLGNMPLEPGFWSRHEPVLPLSLRDHVSLLKYRVPLLFDPVPLRPLLPAPLRWPPHRVLQPVGPDGLALAGAQSPGFAEGDERGFANEYPFAPPECNEEAMQFMARLAAEHHFRIWLAYAPVCEEQLAIPAFREWLRLCDALLQRYAALSDAISHVPGIRSFPASAMQNESHAMPEAAATYTRWLAEAIQRAEP